SGAPKPPESMSSSQLGMRQIHPRARKLAGHGHGLYPWPTPTLNRQPAAFPTRSSHPVVTGSPASGWNCVEKQYRMLLSRLQRVIEVVPDGQAVVRGRVQQDGCQSCETLRSGNDPGSCGKGGGARPPVAIERTQHGVTLEFSRRAHDAVRRECTYFAGPFFRKLLHLYPMALKHGHCSAVTLRNCECGRHQAPHRHVELVVHRHFRRDYGARTAETGTHAGLGDGGVARAFEQLNENRVRAWRSGYASANGN